MDLLDPFAPRDTLPCTFLGTDDERTSEENTVPSGDPLPGDRAATAEGTATR